MKTPHLLIVLLVPALGAGLVSCGKPNEFVPPPPPKVTVQKPLVQEVTYFHELATRTMPDRSVEIRARVRGILESVEFEPGKSVEEGQLLFTIEPEPYEAAVENAKAAVAKAKAADERAEAELQRKEQAFKTNAISEIDVLAARAEKSAAAADVQAAEAALKDAEIQLSYTEIHAPISGRISTNFVDAGNLVGAGESTLLTRIVDDNPILAPIEVNERVYLEFLANNPEIRQQEAANLFFRLKLVDGSIYDKEGTLDYLDNRVNPDTGTITVQAKFPNEGSRLAAGLFGRVLVPEVFENPLLIPAVALQRDIGGDFVAVIGPDNVVERRTITKGPVVGPLLIVQEGLEPEELVVVEGLQSARPGSTVDPRIQDAEPYAAENPMKMEDGDGDGDGDEDQDQEASPESPDEPVSE